MSQTICIKQLDNSDNDCTLCQRDRDLPLNPRLCNSCKGWDDLIHVMECLEPEYPNIDPDHFAYKSGPDDDTSTGQSSSRSGYDQDLGSLNYRPLDQYSSSAACMLCCRIDEAIRISISPQSRIEVGVWRPLSPPENYQNPQRQDLKWRVGYLLPMRPIIEAEDLENEDKQSVRLILPVCARSQATGTSEMPFQTLLVGLEFHYAHCGYELEGITRWDRGQLDPGIIKRFIENCREHHGSYCNEPLWATKLPQFFRVIDTKNWCVQLAPEEPFEYLALSYVWGLPLGTQSQKDIKVLQLDTTTLTELEQKGSLRKYAIPEVILDAINLCADAGYQYLWVDRLCIIQDEGERKQSQINAMDSIYHMATLTIVSLGGYSGDGLPGASSRPRDTREQFKRWRISMRHTTLGKFWRALPPSIHDEVSSSKWDQRGWTYQERVLSRRHLFVSENDFYLNCYHAIFESDSGWKINHHVQSKQSSRDRLGCGYEKGIRKDLGKNDSNGSAMLTYQHAVAMYTARKLTLDQDTLNAFAGVGNLFSSQNNTDLLFGLLEKYFFQSMLWHHVGTWRSRNLKADISIPSWSWAAWEGSVSYITQRWQYNNHVYVFNASSARDLGSLVTFYYVDPFRGLRRIHDNKLWFEREGFADSGDSDELQTQCEDIIRRRVSSIFPRLDTEASVQMWRNSVQNPWNALKHAEIREGEVSLQRNFPGKLAFKTTVAVLEVRECPTTVVSNGQEASGNAPANVMHTKFNLIASDNTVVGQVFASYREMILRTLRSGDKYRVAVLGACLPNTSLFIEPWGLIVVILGRHEEVYCRLALGIVSLRAWTKLSPQWETVLLG